VSADKWTARAGWERFPNARFEPPRLLDGGVGKVVYTKRSIGVHASAGVELSGRDLARGNSRGSSGRESCQDVEVLHPRLFGCDFSAGPHHFSVLISPIARITIAIVEPDSQLDRPQ
jgi:hypothetical protein